MHRRLPEAERSSFQKPFGQVYPDIRALLPCIRGRTVYAVGDVVTYNLVKEGISPQIAIIDGHTMREPCTRVPTLPFRRIVARNPPGTISDDLIWIDTCICFFTVEISSWFTSGGSIAAIRIFALSAPADLRRSSLVASP